MLMGIAGFTWYVVAHQSDAGDELGLDSDNARMRAAMSAILRCQLPRDVVVIGFYTTGGKDPLLYGGLQFKTMSLLKAALQETKAVTEDRDSCRLITNFTPHMIKDWWPQNTRQMDFYAVGLTEASGLIIFIDATQQTLYFLDFHS
jgi:hypothetical protein